MITPDSSLEQPEAQMKSGEDLKALPSFTSVLYMGRGGGLIPQYIN